MLGHSKRSPRPIKSLIHTMTMNLQGIRERYEVGQM